VHKPTAGSPRRHLTSVVSTNAEVLDWAGDGAHGAAPDGAWVTADEQTGGRGRGGRSWHSPRGNLYASVLLRDPGPSSHWAKYGFVCGLALHDALCAIAPDLPHRFGLKWPNDLLVDGAKLSGILLEGHHVPTSNPAQYEAVVVAGFGVNVMSHPAGLPYPATSLLELGLNVSPDQLWDELSQAMEHRRARFHDHGFGPIREDWMERAHGIDGPISVNQVDGVPLEGTFKGIDGQGALLVAEDDETVTTIHTGDILFSGQTSRVA
jgi:BirA family biotin operon repressor/biotin-[acetyl-CoA-carboxylase] ligase